MSKASNIGRDLAANQKGLRKQLRWKKYSVHTAGSHIQSAASVA